MSRGAVELDFLGVEEKEIGSASMPCPQRQPLDRLSSFRGIQSAISRIDPELLASVLAPSGAATRGGSAENAARSKSSSSGPATPKPDQHTAPPVLPVHTPLVRPSPEPRGEVAPLTIFYGGTVAVFDLPPSKAENILKLAVQGTSRSTGPETLKAEATAVAAPSHREHLLVIGDLPLTRGKSLQRFLEKRKERLARSALPYSRDK